MSSAIIGLNDSTLVKLRELRQLNVDSAKGFEECAELTSNHNLIEAFTTIAQERLQQAKTLAIQIEWNDDAEAEYGSYLAAMHRTWIKVREACTSDSKKAIVAEAQRGEETILEAYDEALDECRDSPIYELLVTQREAIAKVVTRIEALDTAMND